jgi:hypothetical protein
MSSNIKAKLAEIINYNNVQMAAISFFVVQVAANDLTLASRPIKSYATVEVQPQHF